jgi:glycosyltransferase involved in cell wall biosynthesis
MDKQLLYLRTDLHKNQLVAGGSVTHTHGVIQGFLAAGYTITYARFVIMPTVEQEPVEKVALHIPQWLWWCGLKLASFLSNFFFYAQVKRVINNRAKPDFIYQRYSMLNWTGVWLSNYLQVPLILEFNGSEVWANKHWGSYGWRKYFQLSWLIGSVERYNLKSAHRIIVVSQALKKSLVAQGVSENKIAVVPNGVDPHYFDPEQLEGKRFELRKKLNLEEKFVFGFVGTFGPWHGIEMLGAIIPEIVRMHGHVHFVLIGYGPLREALIKALESAGVQKFVTLLDTVPREQAREYMAVCDAFLCPTQPNPDGSEFFGSPTKLFEYMSLAKPIIASDIAQLSEILSPAIYCDELDSQDTRERVAILVPPTGKQQFVQAAKMLLEFSPEQRAQLGRCARSSATSLYSWNRHVEKILESVHGSL